MGAACLRARAERTAMSVTELRIVNKGSLPEPDLLREANHRISNHLSLLAGMLQMQAGAVAKGPQTLTRDEVRAILQEAAGKIVGVGTLHRRLAQQPGKAVINLCDYLLEACTTLV